MATPTATMISAEQTDWLPDDDHFARDFIDGDWRFPAAPYDFEIRNPVDSTVTTVVPLSSRFDVDRAVAAGQRAAGTTVWADAGERVSLLHRLVERIDSQRGELARLQSLETGLAPADSSAAVAAAVVLARGVLSRGVPPLTDVEGANASRVSGHVLSWGLPLCEVVTSTLAALLRGDAVVIKPSLRAPLSAVAFARLTEQCGLPGGVVNVVQGTGVDVGAELFSRADLRALHARGSRRTLTQARRAAARTGVPLLDVHAGGNVVVVGRGAVDLDAVAGQLATAVRMHAGPFGVPLLAVHRDVVAETLAAVTGRLADTVAAPLPTEPLRNRALARITALREAGATITVGGTVPDDIGHRMGWRVPPTVIDLGRPGSSAARCAQQIDPLGSTLAVLTWTDWSDIVEHTAQAGRYADGTATLWGVGAGHPPICGRVVSGVEQASWPDGDALAPAWTGHRA